MTARFAAGTEALAGQVRARQDLQRRWQALDAALTKTAWQPAEMRNSEREAVLRKGIGDVDAQLTSADEQLGQRFPRFVELASAKPVSVSDVQGVLDPGEAVVAWTAAVDAQRIYCAH